MNLLSQVTQKLFTARTLAEAGILRPTRPDKALRIANALRRWGPTPAAGYTAAAIRDPGATAIIDELGTLTFEEVHRRTNALAHALSDAGVKEGDGVAIMCRNHRGFIDATVACSKLGAHALYLNTAFAGPQITDVVKREKPVALVYDEEFEGLTHDAAERRKRFIAWHDGDAAPKDPLLEDLIEAGDPDDVVPPAEKGRVVILTSGTTGTPKGAQRKQPQSLDPAAALFSKIPLRAGERTMIAAPMFHSWGFAHFTLGMGLGSTLVLRRKFDPEDTLSATAQHECTALVVVPVMLQRILELAPETIDKYDLSALRVIAASGSALPGELAVKVMDRFGDVLYNLYGSTEVAWATIATPEDLRAAPGTAGRPPRGTVVKLVDEADNEVGVGETGRIFVGNEMAFDGYTGGGNKQSLGGLLSSGDVGHFDSGGRLFIDGRDDEMIVSGGENVFPREIEDLLADHDAVDEVAVIGVVDEQFGQRLKAFVVVTRGANVDADELKDLVKANLARYKVPREIEFLDELPRNATGKVLKRELAERNYVVLLAVVALAAAVVQASTGLGFALVLSPAVFALLEPESAVVAITVLGLALNGLVLFGERRRPVVAWGEVGPILVASVPGAVCGVLVLRALPKSALQIAVGVAVIGAAALRARARREAAVPTAGDPRARLALGFATGTLSTSAGVNGPPIALWFAHRGLGPAEIRDSLSAAFLGLGIIAGVVLAPVLAAADVEIDWGALAAALLCVVAGHAIGRRAFARIDAERYEPLLLAIVVAAGAASIAAGLITAST